MIHLFGSRVLVSRTPFYAALCILMAVFFTSRSSGQTWQQEGPAPITGGQVEEIPDQEVIGAVQAVVPHPTNSSILYVGGVAGGIWKTSNANAATPSWTQLSDAQNSTAIGALALDTSDLSFQTLIAGIGRFSSLGRFGGDRTGILHSTNGGSSWTEISGPMVGRNIGGVAARSNILMASVNTADVFDCADVGVFRSTDTGISWSHATGGIPRGASHALAGEPGDNSVFYADIVFADTCDGAANGIYKSTDSGASWTKISNAAMDALLESHALSHTEIATGAGGVVVVAIAPGSTRVLEGVFHSTDGGASWTAMDLPTTFEDTADIGIHPSFQAFLHLSIAVDPSNSNLVYVGGDRQPLSMGDTGTFPNSLGALNFTGRLFRGDVSKAAGSQWTSLTHSGTASNSAPHADSRDMAINAAGDLIEGDDGGVYKRSSPQNAAGDWTSLNGNLQITEMHDTSYDPVSGILFGGAQDAGTDYQSSVGASSWMTLAENDGGDVAVDAISTPGFSIRYASYQFLLGFARHTFDASNTMTATTTPALTVVSGDPFVGQFVTPLAVNELDGARLIIGGGNSIYESLDRGDTLTEIGPGIVIQALGRNNIAYGAEGNENLIYAGACLGDCFDEMDGLDGVYIRTTSGGTLTHSLSPHDGDTIQGIASNPEDPAAAFVMDSNTVWETSNTGASWSDITGNLITSHAPGKLRSIEFAPIAEDNALLVGAHRGVFVARRSTGFSDWQLLGTGLPDTPVYELIFDPATGQLFAGTFGRGVFSLPLPGSSIFSDGFESGDTSQWSLTFP